MTSAETLPRSPASNRSPRVRQRLPLTNSTGDTDGRARERAIAVAAALVAVAFGIFTAVGSTEWLLWLAALGVVAVAAWTLPLSWSALILIALIPSQFYLNLPETTFTVRGAVLFAGALALRVAPRARWRDQLPWIIPAFLFLAAACIGAWSASSRYAALKGIFDWIPIFVTAFVVGDLAVQPSIRRPVVGVLIAGGIAEALLGLAQYVAGLDSVLAALRMPFAAWFFQPDLLQERLRDMTFNWIVSDRAVPFGTFVNAIDYSLFLAAVLPLILALLLDRPSFATARDRARVLILASSALLLLVTALLTLKASGVLAMGAGVLCLGAFSLRRLSARTLGLAGLLALAALFLSLPLGDVAVQRVLYLIQREQGGTGTLGRLEIWANLLPALGQRPWFGFGLNNAVSLVEPNRTLVGGTFTFIATTPESAYLAALIETGTVGFLALMGWLGAVLLRACRAAIESAESGLAVGALAAMAALLMGNITVASFTTDQNGMLFGALTGIVFGIWNPSSKNTK